MRTETSSQTMSKGNPFIKVLPDTMSGNESPFSEDQRQLLKSMMADVVKEALRVEREKNPMSSEKQPSPQDTEKAGMSSGPSKPYLLAMWWIADKERRAGVRLLCVGQAHGPGTAERHMAT